MKVEIRATDGPDRLLRTENRMPVCGVDFCDRCGDCLHCYGGDPCHLNKDGAHRWVIYDDDPELAESSDETIAALNAEKKT